jgi:superfamily I DNA and RNA helicase
MEPILAAEGVGVNNIQNSFSGDHFIVKNAITLTTVYRAKGNEAGMVYIVGADAFDMFSKDSIKIRNKLFTAITRAKAWVRISGLPAMEWIQTETNQIIDNLPVFKFIYPDLEKIKTLRRELTREAEEKIRSIKDLMTKMESMGLAQEDVINYLVQYKKTDK